MEDFDTNFDIEQDDYPQVTIEDVISILQSETEQAIDETLIQGLSGLSDDDLRCLKPVWDVLDNSYRSLLLQTLVDLTETRLELEYDTLGFMSLDAESAETRQYAIELLRDNETGTLMRRLLRIAQTDPDIQVRAEAVRSLGRFVLRGEFGKLPERSNHQLRETIIDILDNDQEALLVRRRAVESIANSSHEVVPEAINMAYASDDDDVRLSAVIAMGRSCDTQWQSYILQELDNRLPEMRREAVHAAGELQIEEAVPLLIEMLADDDRDVQLAVIRSLGDIGSKEAVRMLNKLLDAATEADDMDMVDVIDDALGAASIVSGEMLMDFDLEAFD